MTQDEEIRRGFEAKRLLDDPLLKDAFDKIERAFVDALKTTPLTDKELEREVVRSLQVLHKVQGLIRDVVTTGKMAEIAKQESLGRRILRRMA